MEVSTEEAALHRSQQLRELYESLSASEPNHQARRPSASLSPEDLTESEWFYLMCVSFSFPPGIGLPGKAYAKRQHVWLTEANEVDSSIFSRAILAKSARIQTVVCIPLLDGVVELGTTERVEEDVGLVQRMASFFRDVQMNPMINTNNPPPLITSSSSTLPPIRPALSEHSTSNPPASSGPPSFHYSPASLPTHDTPVHRPIESRQVADEEEEEDDDEDDEEDQEGSQSDVAPETSLAVGEPSEMIMQLDDMSEDMRLGSPDDGSNHLDSDFHQLLTAAQVSSAHHGRRWPPPSKDPVSSGQPQQPPHSVMQSFDVLTQEDPHYSQTVSTILENQSKHWSNASSNPMHSHGGSAFSKWHASSSIGRRNHDLLLDGSSQWALKYILFTVPFLHTKSTRGTPQDERFIILRSLVPFVTKMDKASILADTIEYVRQLRRKVQELEARARQMETEKERRKMRIVDGGDIGGKAKAAVAVSVQVDVSIIESDALVEIHCMHKEGLLLDVMQMLRKFKIEVTAVQSSTTVNGVFTAELRAKVKEGGKKPSIVEVKRAINQIIARH